MRALVHVAVGVVIGVGLGAIPGESRLQSLRQELAELEDRPCDGGGFTGAIRQVLTPATGDAAAPDAPIEPVADAPDGPVDPQPAPPPSAGDTPDEVKSVLQMRKSQARAALIQDAGLDDTQTTELDAAVAEMNDALMALTDDLVEDVRENGIPGRRDSMVYAAEALDVLIAAEDRMSAVLDDDQRADVDAKALDPTSFVDPALIDRLAELEALGAAEGSGRR